MKRFIVILFSIMLCMVMAISASAEYSRMGINTSTGAFFLDSAEKGGVRSLGSNPFGIEKINIIYVESGSNCYYGGQEGFAMPPVFMRVNYVSATTGTMSNPVICGSPMNVERDWCTVDELFAYCKITKGKALIFSDGMEYYMLMLNGASLPAAEDEPTIALEQKQTISINGIPVEFTTYAIQDKNGGLTNYVRIRDFAVALNGTAAQFDVQWDNAVNVLPGHEYKANGSEFSVPFSGNQSFTYASAPTKRDGTVVPMSAIVITDANGGGYTYYKLRDLGDLLWLAVDWSEEKGITVDIY